ncbi:MAG: glycoside hydrolase family 3 C-terminal domain-containing protein, partial [Muribaculaceae bacterium]|nr:glycoside hydrolase family 3 C-terminal domain-containing protein [Muribaculaceae bacterium]
MDQYGGNNEKEPVLEAFEMARQSHGEQWLRNRLEQSATRLLLNSFRPGLFENPYTDPSFAETFVGNPDLMQRGYAQQIKSIVMLKNRNGVLPLADTLKVYVPHRTVPPTRNYWGGTDAAVDAVPVSSDLAAGRIALTDNVDDADVAVVFIDSPKSYLMGYDPTDKANGGNGYIPISLQYRPYKAKSARARSIAYDPEEDPADIGRSYLGKSARTQNECDLDMLEATRTAMGAKPVVCVINMSNPTVFSEVEPLSDAILIGFSVQTQAFLDIIAGKAEPSGLLPFEMPASMDAIELHNEDTPHDITPYADTEGNTYRFGYGLDWHGPISDWRT